MERAVFRALMKQNLYFSLLITLVVMLFAVALLPPAEAADAADRMKIHEHINRGNMFLDRKRFSEAIREYESALQIDPDNQVAKDNIALAHNNWGIWYFGQRRFAEARREWETALKLNPYDGHVRRNLKILEMHEKNARRHPRRDVEEEEAEEETDEKGRDVEDGPGPPPRAHVKQPGGKDRKDDRKKSAAEVKKKLAPSVILSTGSQNVKMTNDGQLVKPKRAVGASATPVLITRPNLDSQSTGVATYGGTGANAMSGGLQRDTGANAMSGGLQRDTGANAMSGAQKDVQQDPPAGKSTISGASSDPFSDSSTTRKSSSRAPRKTTRVGENKAGPVRFSSGNTSKSTTFNDRNKNRVNWNSPNNSSRDAAISREQENSGRRKSRNNPLTVEESLALLEKKVSGRTRDSIPILKRLEKLEIDTMGKKKSGSIKKRLEELNKTYGI